MDSFADNIYRDWLSREIEKGKIKKPLWWDNQKIRDEYFATIEWIKKPGLPAFPIEKRKYKTFKEFSDEIIEELTKNICGIHEPL